MANFDNPGAPSAARQATAREFLSVVFRRKWVVIGLFLVTTFTVLAINLGQKLVYVSSGKVFVKRGEQESVLTPTRRITGAWEEDLGSEVQVAKSYPVLEIARSILKREEEAGKPAVHLQASGVDAEVVGKSSVLAIAYVDADPEVAQRACDALLKAYIQFRQTDLSLAYPREFFADELSSVKRSLDQLNAQRREYALRENVVDVMEQSRGLIGRMNAIEQRRSDATADLAEARMSFESMQRLAADPDVDLPTFAQSYSNEIALVEMERRLIEAQSRVATLRERYREDSPEVQNALATQQTLREQLKREVDSRLKLAASRVHVLESRVAAFERDLADINKQLEVLPDKASRIAEMDRQIKVLKDRIEEITKKSDVALVNERTSTSVTAYLIEPASASRPANPRDPVRLALAPAFSIVIGIGLAFFVDGLDLTVRTAAHAEEAAELPVLAAVDERRRRRVK